MSVRFRILLLAVVVPLLAVATVWYFCCWDSRSSPLLLDQAKRALTRRAYGEARVLGETLAGRTGHQNAGHFLIAKSLSHQPDATEAIQYFELIPDNDSRYGLAARISSGELLLFRSHRLSPAVENFHRALRIDPHNTQVHERLSYIYGISGLIWRAVPHRMAMLCRQQFGAVHLMLLGLGPSHVEDSDAIQRYYAADQSDPLAQCAMARLAIREDRHSEAAELLQGVSRVHPDWPEPRAWYGELLLQSPDAASMQQWETTLPEGVLTNPEIWFVRGTFARQRQDLRTAARCFAEALRSEPNYQAANFQLAATLQAIGNTEQAQPFLKRAQLLEELVVAVEMWQISQTKRPAIERATKLSAELGLAWEAWGWQQLLGPSESSSKLNPPQLPDVLLNSGSREKAVDLNSVLSAYRAARQTNRHDLIAAGDFQDYPLPRSTLSMQPRLAQDLLSQPAGTIRFQNDASSVGLNFTYVNSGSSATSGERLYQTTGGGVGVLDFDLDGWPDLHFTQGSDWPPPTAAEGSMQSRHLDRLFHNRLGKQFSDVTVQARLIEDRFSQGISVGDLDNDGFPEIYVANIGGNRLFHNNGDGTFSDVTETAGVAGKDWSTSCAIADFNGDSWPDIYVVNYVNGEGIFDRPCILPDGQLRSCTPTEFDATDDRLYQNLGDGRFLDVTADAGIQAPDGKGLGVVAADFDGSGKISLFVGNDTVPNFYFHNQTPDSGGTPRFVEQAFVSGVAVDATGQSQACMGIACGDANDDGLLDLFVTNFQFEANTLYVQQPGSIFSDETRAAGLYQPSFAQLGFGTQFLDADLDGRLDLMATNGHIANLSHRGIPYQMPTQFFRNRGRGQFEELPSAELGEFFRTNHLGRGLARLDWNRDGLADVAVNHLNEPAALLTNNTESGNHFLTLHLRGVQSPRDAVGASVTVTNGAHSMTSQLMSGDGYHASNQRQLTFGLGPSTQAAKVDIRWPSGIAQSYHNLHCDSELLVIEGHTAPIPLTWR